jgi:aerobic carbon-monoxide dehydrogenase large subunit
VIVASGSNPHGQGHDTTFAQIAADRLGVALDDVVLRFGDSEVVPRGIGTFASRSVAMGGSAIAVAADEVLERAREVAAVLLDADLDSLGLDSGRFLAGDRAVTLADVATHEGGLAASARFSSDLVFASGAYAAVVEIERATGVLRVRRIAAVDDAGRIINPLLAEGQVIGGTIQGLGAVTSEEATLDAVGRPLGTTLLAYSLPTAAEQPPIVSAFVTSPSPRNPLGAKGIGEGGAIGTPAAIGNAVADALGGRHVDPPYTAEKLWRALR